MNKYFLLFFATITLTACNNTKSTYSNLHTHGEDPTIAIMRNIDNTNRSIANTTTRIANPTIH